MCQLRNLILFQIPNITQPMKLSSELAEIVGKKEASPADCIQEIWTYINENHRIDAKIKHFFIPDATLAKVVGTNIFGTNRVSCLSMERFVLAHYLELSLELKENHERINLGQYQTSIIPSPLAQCYR